MDAFKYIKTKERMCKSYNDCNDCPVHNICGSEDAREDEELRTLVEIIESKRRQDDFL